MQQSSSLSYSEYEAWCRSRFPVLSSGTEEAMVSSDTLLPDSNEPCPVTVRSVESRAVITPRSKGSL